MAKSLPAMEQARAVVTAFLDERGRALHPEKPRIVQRTAGLDFLGFQVQMRGQQLLMTPQQQTGHALLQAGRSWLKAHPPVTAEVVMRHLHPRIRGWAMYDRPVVSKHTCQYVDYHSWRARWHWVKRRPPRNPRRWLYRRDVEGGTSGATFYAERRDRRGQTSRRRLERRPTLPIVHPVTGKGHARPDAPPESVWGE